jgi:phosphotransferase system enzyme I (PtsI)
MLKGINASGGYGIGNVLIVKEQNLEYTPKTSCNPDEELKRYRDAVADFCLKTEKAAERMRNTVGEKEAEILSGHIIMMKDPYMNSEIEKLINAGKCAESALEEICDMFIMVFSSAEDELTKQRASDVRDIKDAVLSILLGAEQTDISQAPARTVLVAKDLTPSMTAGINKENIVGIITEIGGKTSHSAILARAMEIPAVLSVSGASQVLSDGDEVIVDGCAGNIIVKPAKPEADYYTQKRVDFIEEKKALSKVVGKETLSADSLKLELLANIGKPDDAAKVIECDGEGVGLFRTEFLFMDRTTAPSEEEQFEAYKKAALIMKGKPVIIRTLDVGGDKDIPYLKLKKEDNPFLGFRAVRYCLKNRESYITQLRALIRASAFGDVRIMIPLVTSVSEVREVKKMAGEIMTELANESVSFNRNIKIGIMVETPAAAVIADLLAHEADFFSIGTNDLTQYTMAADRGNPDVAYMYSWYDPAVLRSVQRIISCAKQAGIPVGMCGEAAADKNMIPLLISFGLDEFSVSPTSVLSVRKEISKWSKKSADLLTQKIMALETRDEVETAFKEETF